MQSLNSLETLFFQPLSYIFQLSFLYIGSLCIFLLRLTIDCQLVKGSTEHIANQRLQFNFPDLPETIMAMAHKAKCGCCSANDSIQNRSNQSIKMSVNAVKTTKLLWASLGPRFRLKNWGDCGDAEGEKHENHLSTRCAFDIRSIQPSPSAKTAKTEHQSQSGEVEWAEEGSASELELLASSCTCDGQEIRKNKERFEP